MSDSPPLHPLQRFVAAQERIYPTVVMELKNASKQTHWMWFVFPQIAGLGHSDMARQYAIASLDEARAYLGHPLLGVRLCECCTLLLGLEEQSAERIFGYPDYMKFRSSLTLFSTITDKGDVFDQCLAKFFGGVPDDATLRLL